MEYDFSALNDKEFEILSADLLGSEMGCRFERFKSGKDGGVDARTYISDKGEAIIQCKHYIRSGVRALIESLKREVAKISKISPSRYIIATSCPLSRQNKQLILSTAHPHCQSEADIFGQEDINDLLRKHPLVEIRHTKLWISSTTILDHILHNGVRGRSEDFLIQISKQSRFFVEVANFGEARSMLAANHVLILSGEPGVGKTTLAENICLLHAANNFQVIDIIRDLAEAEDVYKQEEKQIFVFDDFLGSNYLDAILGRTDSHICKFIKRVVNDEHKRFVLTTRTHILNRALSVSDPLKNSNITSNEFLLEVGQLSELEKAKIFYNHIWHGNLGNEFIEQIYKNQRYLSVIKHKNFNPRIIQFITDPSRAGFPTPLDYWDFIVRMLNNPASIWSHAFWNQSSDEVRCLVNLVVFAGGSISETSLKESFEIYDRLFSENRKLTCSKRCREALEIAARSFLVRSIAGDETAARISLFNPSITDFVVSEFKNEAEELGKLFASLGTENSLNNLAALTKQEVISKDCHNQILKAIHKARSEARKSTNYLIALISLGGDINEEEEITKILRQLQQSPESISRKWLLLSWLSDRPSMLPQSDLKFLAECFGNESLDYEESALLAKLIVERDIDEADPIFTICLESLNAVVVEALDEISSEINVDKYIAWTDDGDGDYTCDTSDLEDQIKENLTNQFSDFPIQFENHIFNTIESTMDELDCHDLVNDWMKNNYEDNESRWSEGISSGRGSREEVIHDLFERG